MKNTPLLIGIILLLAGLIGIVFDQFSVLLFWFLVVLGIIVIVWTVMASTKSKDIEKK